MGDTNETTTEIQSEGKIGNCDVPKSSIEILKKVEPSENIAISKVNEEVKVSAEAAEQSKESEPAEPSAKNERTEEVKETSDETSKTVDEPKDEKPAASESKKDESAVDEAKPEKLAEETEKDDAQQKEKSTLKNRSDIFSLNENKNMPSTIFSVGGAPSKSIYKTSSSNSSASKDTIGSSNSKKSQLRNPLTGIGVSSNDEYKSRPTKRRDGNPLLGVGYKDDEEFFSPPTTQRIPPGGHSKGLW